MPIMPCVRVPAPAAKLVVVYDLGGGTFDASVISMAARRHEVLRSAGIAQLVGMMWMPSALTWRWDRFGVQDWIASERSAAAGGVPGKERGPPSEHAPTGD